MMLVHPSGFGKERQRRFPSPRKIRMLIFPSSPARCAETLWHWHLSYVILANIIGYMTLGIDRQDAWVFQER